jgi:hypothetical protein
MNFSEGTAVVMLGLKPAPCPEPGKSTDRPGQNGLPCCLCYRLIDVESECAWAWAWNHVKQLLCRVQFSDCVVGKHCTHLADCSAKFFCSSVAHCNVEGSYSWEVLDVAF